MPTPVIDQFIDDVKEILRQSGETDEGLQRIAARMSGFIAIPGVADGLEPPEGNVHTRQQTAPLYTDDSGLTLALARFDPDHMTPIHNHGSWGVVGVYEGRDIYQEWRRLDPGHGPGEARIELIDERILGAGDVAIVPPPPQDIHAQQGSGDETALEFVLFGKNVMEIPRLYFDPDQHTAAENQVSTISAGANQ